jgi:hypothetical protein
VRQPRSYNVRVYPRGHAASTAWSRTRALESSGRLRTCRSYGRSCDVRPSGQLLLAPMEIRRERDAPTEILALKTWYFKEESCAKEFLFS